MELTPHCDPPMGYLQPTCGTFCVLIGGILLLQRGEHDKMNWRYEDAFGTCMQRAAEIVGRNLRALIQREKDRGGRLRSFQAIEDATAAMGMPVGRSTVDRIAKGAANPELGHIEALAKVFEVEVWQLLAPTFDPANLPVLRSVGAVEDAIYEKLKALSEELVAMAPGAVPQPGSPAPRRRKSDLRESFQGGMSGFGGLDELPEPKKKGRG